MISLLQDVYVCGGCSFAGRRREGETCREHMTAMQGRPYPGCYFCETKDLLEEIGRLPERR